MTGTAVVLQGTALQLPLADSSVDLICTSPPYFALRSYRDAGEHYDGQIGSEATPTEFLDALLAATGEMVRVLKPSGGIFVNLGDKYAGSSIDNRERPPGPTLQNPRNSSMRSSGVIRAPKTDVRAKSLIGVPWRYAIACIDQLGLILRAEIIWNKPNGLPESVTDRVRRSHEQWFHFTVQPRYFAAVDEIREPHNPNTHARGKGGAEERDGVSLPTWGDGGTQSLRGVDKRYIKDPLGKLPGSVWSIPSQPLTVPPELGIDHFAAYPMEWPRRLIQGWTPTGICTVCGEGRRPVASAVYDNQGRTTNGPQSLDRRFESIGFPARAVRETTITGYMCGCPTPTAPTRPAVVLDPFGGTGTTALVAKALGRIGITVDLSADYCRLAEWRCNDPRELAAALQVEKPEAVPDGQLSLFDVTPTREG